MKVCVAAALSLLTSVAIAQPAQQTDIDMSRICSVIEQQRNGAMSALAQAQAQLSKIQEENGKLRADAEKHVHPPAK